jgi:hypothetical protein
MTFPLNRRRLLAWLGLAPAAAVAGATTAVTATPPRRPVRVLFTRINGEAYYEMADSLATLVEGDPVTLRREPDNVHDRRAIVATDANGRKLGYLARVDNSAVARMMDAGERFQARVARIDRRARDVRLAVDWLPS